MLNPSAVNRFNDKGISMLQELVSRLGEDRASRCYIVPDWYVRVNDALLPGALRVDFNNDKDRIEIQYIIVKFMLDHTSEEDETMIAVLKNEGPREGDIPLCLSSC